MLRYILKRLIEIIPVMLGIAFIIYAIMSFTPGDPARLILGANATNEAVENLREEMGLNDPFLVQFFHYIWRIVSKGDFGNSYKSGQPVFQEIFKRFPVSLNLAICGMIGSCMPSSRIPPQTTSFRSLPWPLLPCPPSGWPWSWCWSFPFD